MNNKISIIIPAYKSEKYIKQCLDSVLSQTLSDIEIIIIDEGKIDEQRTIIDNYEQKDSRIKTIHEYNGCYGIAVNKGINIAQGEYIGIVEADDFIDKDMYKNLYELAKKYDADIVKSDFFIYHSETNQSRKAGVIKKSLEGKITNIFQNSSILRIIPSIWSAIYKREFLLNNDIKCTEKQNGCFQDTAFVFKAISLAQKIVFTSKAYLHYRTDNENSTSNSKNKAFAIIDEYEGITNFLNINPQIKAVALNEKLINQYNAYKWNMQRIAENYQEEFLNKFSEEFKTLYEKNEISPKFLKKINKKEFKLLINNKEKFFNYFRKESENKKNKNNRQKYFSIHINSSRIDIVLFKKQILAIDL